jgi:hypothetical protein
LPPTPCFDPQGLLGGVKVRNLKTDKLTDLPLAGVFFAIGARQPLACGIFCVLGVLVHAVGLGCCWLWL